MVAILWVVFYDCNRMMSLKLNCKFEVMVSENDFGEEKIKLLFLLSKEK